MSNQRIIMNYAEFETMQQQQLKRGIRWGLISANQTLIATLEIAEDPKFQNEMFIEGIKWAMESIKELSAEDVITHATDYGFGE